MMTNLKMSPNKAPKGIVGLLKRLNFIVFFVLSFSVFSQNTNGNLITGSVLDSDGVPLPGATVVLLGSNNGTVTDFDGNFEIEISEEYYQLEFRYIGYKPQVVDARNQSTLEITLQFDQNSLDEVVVIGYGEQSKRNVTGSVSKVKLEETENLPNTNITQSLRGRVAGVQFTDNGRPGQNGNMVIRGPNSLSAGNNPLIVLDGVFFNGSLTDINPNDIESIEVLKDASASAIYGSRAANGVLLITSKKGTTDKPNIRLNTFTGFSEWSSRLKLLSPERYVEKSQDVREQNGMVYDPDDPESYLTLTEAANFREGKTIDPYDEISQLGRITSFDVNVSGRTPNTNYFLSGSFVEEKGLVKNDNLKRTSLRINLENKITDWLTIGTNSMFSIRDISGVPASITLAQRQSPYGTWYREDGSPTQFTVPEDQAISNPLRDAFLTKNYYVYNNLFGNFHAKLKIPKIDGLTYRVNYSNNYRWIREYEAMFQDEYLPDDNTTSASKRNRHANDWLLENILNYKLDVKDHDFDITFLYGVNKEFYETTSASVVQLEPDLLGWNSLELGSFPVVNSHAEESSGVSTMARLNYRFKDKYLLTLTTRRDGSSVFAANNKYATFPSAAISWIASEENFLKDAEFLDFLKFRVSHGKVGNQAISPYQSLSLANSEYYVYGDGANPSLGIYPSNIANSNLKWETTTSSNVALDFELFDHRLGGTVEFYNMDTNDLLVERTLPTATGYESVWTNLGEINNRGIELTLNSANVRTDKFEWNSSFVFSHNKNKIVHLYGEDADGDGIEDDDISNSWFIGEPITSYYDYVFDGIYQNGDEDIPDGFRPGYARFKDLNGDGEIDAEHDRKIVGHGAQPKYRLGLNNTFRYGNFEMSIFVNAMLGWQGEFNELDHYSNSINPIRPANMLDAGWWTEENQSNTRPSLLYNRSVVGHNWYLSRDFVRIQDVSLSYNFPSEFLEKNGISNLKLFLSGKNLKTFTDWLGTNPETITSYPLPRTITLGLNFGF